jgi:S-DNA-T family DNA segregation ATPase FtsK/SpoIIIE
VATQRPSVDVITGLIKANLPTRISFQVTARVDSRTILDRNGAEQLLGSGDMLFVPPHTSDLIRVQGTFVSDREMRRVVDHVTHGREADYALDINNWGGVETNEDMGERDELYDQALRIVLESQRGSVSLLQRQLGIGYTRAARLVDLMAAQGVVGTYKGSQAREVLYTLEEWLAMHPDTATAAQSEADAPPLEATTEVDDDDKEED